MKARLALFLCLWCPIARADGPPVEVRQDLAREIYSFLYEHAVCFDPGQEPPCDFVYDGAFQLHWLAKELYSAKPVSQIRMAESDYSRGGYRPYYSAINYLSHQSILARAWLLLNWGIIPPRREMP